MRQIVVVTVAALLSGPSSGSRRSPAAGIDQVAWLQGCWSAHSAQEVIEEQWMAPRGGSMVGMSRTVRGDRLVGFELVVLREEDDGLVYQAHPAGQPGAVFSSRAVRESLVLFENPGHDFPQRIGYQRDGPDGLLAWIEGDDQGSARRIEFRYRRVGCPGVQ